jgi:hypothetical protein
MSDVHTLAAVRQIDEHIATGRVLTICNFIDNALVPPANGEYVDSYNPATGAVWARVPDSCARCVDAAVTAAQRAFDW